MSEQQQPKEYIITENRLEQMITCSDREECDGCPYEKSHVGCLPATWDKEIRSRPHPAPLAPMPNDYRELFIRDMLYNFRWTAEHGNPEFFKAVDMIKREYLKPESQLLAEHDAAIVEQARRKEREQVLKIIDSGISALDEITVDGYVPLGERGKRDVLVWLREKVQKESLREGAK